MYHKFIYKNLGICITSIKEYDPLYKLYIYNTDHKTRHKNDVFRSKSARRMVQILA